MSLLLSRFYPQASAVLTSGNQNISGIKNFDSRPTVRGTGVLLQGEAAGGGGPVILPSDILFTTGTQIITGPKNFTARPTFSGINLITTGDLVNLELNLIGLENFVRTTGNQNITGIKNFNLRPTVSGVGVLLQGEAAGSSLDPFNGNRQIKATPVNNTNYGGSTISGFLENMFFPFISGSVSLNNFPIYTYGINSVSAISFTGNITLNDNTITGIAFIGGNTVLSGPSARTVGGAYGQIIPSLVQLGTTLTASSSDIYRTRIFVQRDNESSIIESSPNQRIRFEPRYYFGVSNNPNLGSLVTGLNGVSNPATYTYNFGSKPSSVTHSNFQPNGQYIYFAYPSPVSSPQEGIINWGDTLTSIYEINQNFEYITAYQQLPPVTLNFPAFGKNLRYRIYRSNNLYTLLEGQSWTLRFTFGA